MKRLFLVALALVALAGCATMPVTGPVRSDPRQTAGAEPGGIQIEPNPPPQGAQPLQIVQGFLAAMASFQPGFETARSYLTTDAGKAWHPESQVLIYASGSTPTVTGTQASMSATLVGQLGPDGTFGAAPGGRWNHDFGLVQENGEWRISIPPDGLAVSQYMFTQSFQRVEIYLFSNSTPTLVPDPRYVQRGAWEATTAARLVLDGASAWLAPVIDNSYRQVAALAGAVSVTETGTAVVPLRLTGSLTASAAASLAVEMAATMASVPGVTRVQFTSQSMVVSLSPLGGALPDSSLAVGYALSYETARAAGPAPLYALVGGVLGTVEVGGFVPSAGAWETARDLTSFALSRDQTQVAAVTAHGLLWGPRTAAEPAEILAAPTLVRPQFDVNGTVWVMGNSPAGVTAWAGTNGAVRSLDTSVLAGRHVVSFSVASDGRRLLILSTPANDPTAEPAVDAALVTDDQQGPAAITGIRPLQVAFQGTQLTGISDVAWLGPTSVLAVGTAGTSPLPEAFSLDLDGFNADEWGNPEGHTITTVATFATAQAQLTAVLDNKGTVWAYQEGQQWASVADKVTAIAYPA